MFRSVDQMPRVLAIAVRTSITKLEIALGVRAMWRGGDLLESRVDLRGSSGMAFTPREYCSSTLGCRVETRNSAHSDSVPELAIKKPEVCTERVLFSGPCSALQSAAFFLPVNLMLGLVVGEPNIAFVSWGYFSRSTHWSRNTDTEAACGHLLTSSGSRSLFL